MQAIDISAENAAGNVETEVQAQPLETKHGNLAARDARTIATRHRENQVLELRKHGKPWFAIAEIVGYANADGAYKAFQRAIARIPKANAQETLELELERLDAMQSAFIVLACNGDKEAADRLLKIMDRRAKYLGLDRPVRLEHTGANGGAININLDSLTDEQLEQIASGRSEAFSQMAAGISGAGEVVTEATDAGEGSGSERESD